MQSNNKYRTLAALAKDIRLLYVEDNAGIQKQAGTIFKKFFKEVFIAPDGQVGLELFKKNEPDIVITDINMPNMDGLEMSKQIRELDLNTKIVITTAFDDKDKLLVALDLKIDKYLKKPISIDSLTTALLEVATEITHQRNKKIFDLFVHDVFEYQDTILVFIQERDVLIANKKCMEFFGQKNLEEFKKFFNNFSNLLLAHKDFLYDKDGKDWLNVAKGNAGKLFNVKIADIYKNNRHFILKIHQIPKKEQMFVLSFDDITELNLLGEEEKNTQGGILKDTLTPELSDEKQKQNILNILEVIKRNQSVIRLYNFYKGLSISNIGNIISLNSDSIRIKTSYLQQRAIQNSKSTIIESELFPKAIYCELEKINFESQITTLKNFVFIDTLPSEQKFVRVMPEDTHEIVAFRENRKLNMGLKINDISVKGVQLSTIDMEPKIEIADELILQITLGGDTSAIKLRVKAKVINVSQHEKKSEIICIFYESEDTNKILVNYISKRQLSLIREFKGLQYAE